MKKIVLIGLAIATALGVGFFLYNKSKTKTQDDEMITAAPATPPPADNEAVTEPPTEGEPMPESAPESTPAATAKPKTKAASGHFEMSRPAPHDEVDPQDNPGFGKAREKRLREIFSSDPDLSRTILVKNIHCRVDTCSVEAESKDGDADRFQSLMYALLKQYPWIGNKIDVTTPDGNPLKGRFVYFHETPK